MPLEVLSQEVDGLIVEDDPAMLMRLGVLLDPVSVNVEPDRAVETHDLPVQVDVLPVQSAHLAPSSTDCGSDPDERSPIRVAARCLLNQSGCFVCCGRSVLIVDPGSDDPDSDAAQIDRLVTQHVENTHRARLTTADEVEVAKQLAGAMMRSRTACR